MVIDSLSSSNYIGLDAITKLKLKPIREEVRIIETLYNKVEKRCPIYQLKLGSLSSRYKLNIEAIGLDKSFVTRVTNPQIRQIKKVKLKS